MKLTTLVILALSAMTVRGQEIYWTTTYGPEGSNVVAIHSTGIRVFAGTLGDGIFQQTGSSWEPRNAGLASLDVRAIASNSSERLYAGTGGGLVYGSDDHGTTWNQLTETGIGDIYTLTITPDGTIFAGGNGGVCRSTDDGVSWETDDMGMAHLEISDIIHLPTNVLLVGTVGMGAFRSTDNGETWVQTFAGSPDNFISSFDVNSTGVFCASLLGIFHSTDDGLTWSELTDPEGAYILDIEVEWDICFATSTSGVFSTTDFGMSWQQENSGLGDLDVNCFGTGGTMYAGTDGGGVYVALWPLDVASDGNGTPEEFVLLQNYPNPFNPATEIGYRVFRREEIVLTVFDLAGREVGLLVDEIQDPGEYSVTWDASELGSGVYFYTLEAGNFRATRKLLLLK